MNSGQIIGLILILIIDLLLTAIRIADGRGFLTRITLPGGGQENVSVRSHEFIQQSLRIKGSLEFLQTLAYFGLVLILLYSLWKEPGMTALGATVGWLFLAALFISVMQWIAEGIIERDAETWAKRLSHLAWFITKLCAPILPVLLSIRKDTWHAPEESSSAIEDELKILLDAGEMEGILEQSSGRMITSIVGMSGTLAREIMVPRIDMLTFEVSTPIEQAMDVFIQSGHSRLPVYEETVDNILGLLYAKDLLRVWREGNRDVSLREMLRPVHFIPEAKKINDLLAEMQQERIHMTMVVDEYGGVAGLVTLEDIVEEILGEIQDEYDQAEELPYFEAGDGVFVFRARVDLDDVNDVLGTNLAKDEADTLGGLIYSRLGRVPLGGEKILVGGLELTVEQVVARRIRKVRVVRVPDEDQHDNGE